MTRRGLRVRIGPDGRLRAETLGFVGEACLDVVPLVEQLLDGEVVESQYLPEFFTTAATGTTTAVEEDELDREPPRYVTERERS